jgi:hypothetical protein
VRSGSLFEVPKQGGFHILRVGIHFACRNFLVRGALKTQLANPQSVFRPYWWPEDAACHRAGFIELAESSAGIECWARLIVGKFSKALLRLLAFI